MKPDWYGVRIGLLVGTAKKNFGYFRFSCRPKSGEVGRWVQRIRSVRRCRSCIVSEGETEFGYFISEEKSKAIGE